MTQPHPGGRPKITPADFPKDWKQRVLEEYKSGASDVEIYASYLDICHETFTRLLNEDSEFSETIKKGRKLSEAWWVANGRINLKDKDFNYTGWYMNMKNRFRWTDRQEQSHGGIEGAPAIKTDNTVKLTPDEAYLRMLNGR